MKSKFNPIEMKIGISSLKSPKNSNLLIESDNKSEVEALCTKINKKCGEELLASTSNLRNPQMIIYNVPEEITVDNASQAITVQNTMLNLNQIDE
jgi:hypothetical protein